MSVLLNRIKNPYSEGPLRNDRTKNGYIAMPKTLLIVTQATKRLSEIWVIDHANAEAHGNSVQI